jgi:hypothetical protein
VIVVPTSHVSSLQFILGYKQKQVHLTQFKSLPNNVLEVRKIITSFVIAWVLVRYVIYRYIRIFFMSFL